MSKTLIHHLLQRKESAKTDVAVKFKEGERWLKYTWQEYFSLIEALGTAFLTLDIRRGDCIAIISDSRPEWSCADLAILGVGAITVPIYPNNLDEDVEFILNDSQAKVLILEDQEQIDKWQRIQTKCLSVQHVLVIERLKQTPKDFISWTEALTRGRQALQEQPRQFVDAAKASSIDEIATILYTSGTTGRPKGVVLTHVQIMSELEDVFRIVPVTEEDMTLTFLPFSHILGRVEAWGSVYTGYVLAFAESIDKIKANLKEIKPTFLIAVPRIFEKIFGGIMAQVENNQTKRKIFEKAMAIGRLVSDKLQSKQTLPWLLSMEYEIAKIAVFDNVLKAMGGKLRFAVSGGAPLSPDIARFFHGMGLLICEGYGLSETTAGISFNSPLSYKIGTVGKPLADVDIRIAGDGEILVKSNKVMKEYFNNPEATAEAFDDGYFKTGDIGHLDSDGFLLITDRKKDLIKTAGGKYVAPQKLENLLKTNPGISNVLIHGDQKKYIVALITLSDPLSKRASDPTTYQTIKDAVAEANTHLASYESIKKFAILPRDFTVATGELTPSLKVKRRYCDQKYKDTIDSLY